MVSIRGLEFAYGKSELFTDLSLQVEPGNIYGLLGKNGAGKTSLLKIIAGLLFPDRGNCQTLDWEPRRRSPAMLGQLFFLPEEFFLPAVVPLQYLALYAPFYPRFDREAFLRYLAEFEIPREQRVSSLSYGQKKKFLLSFGLATEARLLLLDEPTNGLDIPSKSQFRRIVASALTEERTFLISTHQVRDMENLIDPVIIIEDGRIIFNRAIDEISRKVRISRSTEAPDPSTVLYSERVLGGYTFVIAGEPQDDASIDLETLFNMVIAAGERLDLLFSDGPQGGTA